MVESPATLGVMTCNPGQTRGSNELGFSRYGTVMCRSANPDGPALASMVRSANLGTKEVASC